MANLAEVVVIVHNLHKKLPTNTIPVKIADILSAISTATSTQINVIGPQNWEGNQIGGMLLHYPDSTPKRADVLVKCKSASKCWQRFVACKEMSHLLIDHEPQFSLDVVSLVESFLMATQPEKLDQALSSEYWAFRCAIEILVPWQLRPMIIEMIQSGSANLDIAKKFMVPERIIEYWRGPDYQEMMTKAWEDMETEHETIGPKNV